MSNETVSNPAAHDAPVRPETAGNAHGAHSDGTDVARARTDALGRVPGPNGSDTEPDRANGAHGANAAAHTRIGPRLDGNTDTRGLVSDEERARLQPFGTSVRTMRKDARLTQEQLGKLAGIGTTHISRLEQGRRRPSVDAIQALARVLAPEGTTEVVEQRLARLAGDSLRTGAARKKRQRNNKHRRHALQTMERAQRTLKRLADGNARFDVSGLLNSGEEITARMRAEVEAEPAGIRGVIPADERARQARHGYGRPKSRSLKDIQAWLDSHEPERFADDDEAE